MKMIKQKYVIIGLLATSFFISSCSRGQQNGSSPTSDGVPKNNKIQSVEVEKAQKRSFVAEVLITGTARPNQKVTLYAMESGYVQNIGTDIGDMVSKGEVIAELANPELVRQYEQKKAQLKAKKSIYERLKSTQEKATAITPLQLVEDAEAEYLSVNASLNAIKDRMNFLSVKAPFAGKITKKLVDHGALVQSGLTEDNPQGIVELQEISPIRLTIPLPESDVTAIETGMDVTVTFPELPGESFQAKISRTAGALDPASKTMQVEIDIDNPRGFIKPGMYAKALMQISRRESVLSLPVTAQWIFQNQPFVLIVEDSKVKRVPLRKGLSNKDYFEVLNPEITESSLVIVQGKGLVQPGQIVNPVLRSK
ncbi:MAG: efflux RND transporter periplasmic adaptor subunit [Candidatus Scalindua sp.]|nr:efflux RND transporter periplasmic adaptor subunit [Candidatus Scalindua sp.]